MASEWFDRLLAKFMLNFRWVFVIPILLPISAVYEVWFYLRNWCVFQLHSAPSQHASKVAAVQEQVRQWQRNGRKEQMCTARPGWLTMSFRQPLYKARMHNVSLASMVDILEVNVENRTVRVEPMVTMGQLTATLNPLGWTIPVVPELDDLTVGGLINGQGLESSSHKYGLFHETCREFEIVTADGSVVVARGFPDENADDGNLAHSDLFHALPMSHGTLGFLTSATLDIIPAKPFVELTYIPCLGQKAFAETMANQAQNMHNEFVEGLTFSRESGVVMTARFAAKPDKANQVNEIGRWHKPWFYKHVQQILHNGKNVVEFVPLRHYYHRHSKSIFWELEEIIPFGNNKTFRTLFGWLLPPKISLLKLTTPAPLKRLYERHHMIQDLWVPIEKLPEAIDLVDSEIDFQPLWICAFRLPSRPGLMVAEEKGDRENETKLYVDIGIYGTAKRQNYLPETTTKQLERFLLSVQGFQMLYADTYMTEGEFRQMYNHALYDKSRKTFCCEDAFPSIFEKVCKAARK